MTTYYILHRHDFGMEDAPIGACILYAVSCNLSDNDLTNRHELLLRTGGLAAAAAEDAEDDPTEDDEAIDADADPVEGTAARSSSAPGTAAGGSDGPRRRRPPAPDRPGPPPDVPLEAGDVVKVDDYLDAGGSAERSVPPTPSGPDRAGRPATDERVILEGHQQPPGARGVSPVRSLTLPGLGDEPEEQ
ncbi:MAG: hypothetical protein WKF75_07465 [Singulisphaera sp.]